MSERVTKHGIDVNGHAYTRQVNPQRQGPSLGGKGTTASAVPPAAIEPNWHEQPGATDIEQASLLEGRTRFAPEPAPGFTLMTPEHRAMWSNRIVNGTDSGEDSVALARSLDENVGTLNAVLSSCFNGEHREQARRELQSLAAAAVATKTQDSYPHVVAAQALASWVAEEPEERVRHWLDEVPADNVLGQQLREVMDENMKRDTKFFQGLKPVL